MAETTGEITDEATGAPHPHLGGPGIPQQGFVEGTANLWRAAGRKNVRHGGMSNDDEELEEPREPDDEYAESDELIEAEPIRS